MIVHPFYRTHNLRLHEIPKGVKCPVVKDWPNTQKRADDVGPLLDGERFNKYGWILDDCHVVIDIDVHDEAANGFDSLAKLETEIGFRLSAACGAIVDTPSGGRHYYFAKPEDVSFGKVFKDRYPGIDFINGKGKQVVAANSFHDLHDGTYRMSGDGGLLEIPNVLIDHLCGLRPEKTKPKLSESFSMDALDRSGDEFNKSRRGIETIISLLEPMGYSFRSKGDYWEFDRPGKTTDSKCSGHLGKVSKSGNYQLTSFSLSDPNFSSGDSVSIFHAFAQLCCDGDHVRAASELYQRGFAEQTVEYPGVDISLLIGEDRGDDFDDEDFSLSMVPESGILREVFDLYSQISHRKSNVMGLAVAVSFCETIFGRRIASHTDLRTNDYNVIIAPTNCGKEACEKTITKIFEAVAGGEAFMIPPDVQSGNGLLRSIATNKCSIWVADEFGKVLASVLDKRQKTPHLVQIATHLLKLYGKADAIYGGAAHSDGNRHRVNQPHLVALGLTTGSTLFESVDAANVSDGLFGRIAFWPVQSRPKRRRMVKTEPSAELLEKVTNWVRWEPSGNLGSEFPNPAVIQMSDEALRRWNDHSDAIDEKMESEKETRSAIWGRVAARSMKLALVHLASRQIGDPAVIAWDFIEIEMKDIEWGISVSNWLGRIACDLISQNFVDSSANRHKDLISAAVKTNGELTTRDILRARRALTKGELMAIAEELQSEGTITIQRVFTGGRPTIKLVSVQPFQAC
jgi:hypothetical protein